MIIEAKHPRIAFSAEPHASLIIVTSYQLSVTTTEGVCSLDEGIPYPYTHPNYSLHCLLS